MGRINKKNLKRTREYMVEVNGSMINMGYYRSDFFDTFNPECNSIGCIIGHATALDAENVIKNFTNKKGIKFAKWSEEFFGIGKDSALWRYLFSGNTEDIKEYHIYRMDYILAGNETPITKGLFHGYSYTKYYDDGYLIPIDMKL